MSLTPWKGKQSEDSGEDLSANAMGQFRAEVDRLCDRFLGGPWSLGREVFARGAGWMPAVDVSESETEVVVRAEVAGVGPEALDLTVSGQLLMIRGEKKESTETLEENFYRSERRFGSFQRSVQLPTSVDTDTVSAEHKSGVLTIRLKKLQSAQPKRIPVQG
jgi:HSP20 family protein